MSELFVFCFAEIMIAGSSLVTRMASFLEGSGALLRVPLPVTFAGRPGLHLAGLRTLKDQSLNGCPPACVVLHVGAKDTGLLHEYE